MTFAPASDEEFSQLGRWVVERYQRPFQIATDDGTRDITGYEMCALLAAQRDLAREKRDREGCCGDGDEVEGRCFGCVGWCPRVTEARQAEAFCRRFLNWLEPKEEVHDDWNDD